ncbi:MAG: TIGR02757 family protein [bacterium]
MTRLSASMHKKHLERIYRRYHKREFLHTDPVEFLHDYPDLRDREIVGFIASALAYGRVAQIGKSVSHVLGRIQSPYDFLKRTSQKSLLGAFSDFRHRFTSGEELAAALYALKKIIDRYGSIEGCFNAAYRADDDTILPALSFFVAECAREGAGSRSSLLASPSGGSACKRLNLYLRWMVRRDDVDPGGWERISPSKLIVPLDTHMFRICRALGFTKRRQADLRSAIEVTEAFRKLCPTDPVKYDFALTRSGILKNLNGGRPNGKRGKAMTR